MFIPVTDACNDKTIFGCFFVCRVPIATVVGATSSEDFVAVFTLPSAG